ncbi:MAG: hypothetical protein A2X64_05370 [Ignavibacteria bacterium GWF2_33_9]|nr:MAG: hypothetical protein A2X64_05370 [Ignavibacteria bacterium GWF2_33_9]
MNLRNQIYKFFALLQWVLISGIIFYLSSQSSIEFLPKEIWNFDKLVHLAAYMVYGGSTFLMLYSIFVNNIKVKYIMVLTVIIGAFFSATDEIHQSYTPGRDSDFFDFLADFIGIVVSIILFYYLLKKIKKK